MAAPAAGYTYRAALGRVIDGDTHVYTIDLGCYVAITRTVRVLGVNAPEVEGPQRAAGLAASAWAARWLAEAAADPGNKWPLVIATTLDKGDKYGRLLGTIYRTSDGQQFNRALLDAGMAVAYDGGQR